MKRGNLCLVLIKKFFQFFAISLFVSVFLNQPLYSKSKTLFIYEGELKLESSIATISKQRYISFSDVAKIYNLTLSYKPVSGKVILSGLNKKITFIINSSRYSIGDAKRRMNAPVALVKNTVFLPASFLTSSEFSDFTETETNFIPETTTYIISIRHNINPPRYHSQSDKTKIIIETKERLPSSHKISSGKLTVEFARGKAIEESIGINDGIVREVKLSNKNRVSFVEIFLTEAAGEPVLEQKSDTSLVISIPRTSLAPEVQAITHAEEIGTSPVDISTDIASTMVSVGTRAVSVEKEVIVATPSIKPQPQPTIKPLSKKIKIVIDAGHGGEDPGAIGPNGTMEKDVNLAITRELAHLFEDEKNIEIILTRKDDTFIPLVDRTNIANENHADIFISIHCNASLKKTSYGFEVYFLSENVSDPDAMATQILENSVVELEKKPDKKRTKLQELLWSMIVNEFINESSELCYLISQEIPRRIKVENRGVKQAGFYVLRGAQMPAVLVECAFISNHAEEIKLRNPRIQKQIADGIYVAIKNYIKRKNLLGN